MSAPESIKELMYKIHALATGGVGGEAENAQKKLDGLLERYGMTIEDITSKEMKTYQFKFNGKRDESLLNQCAAKVMGKWRGAYSYRRGGKKTRNITGYDLTATEHADLTEMVTYYRSIYEKECDAMLQAFIYKHELFASERVNTEAKPMTVAEMLALEKRIRSLQEKSFVKIAGHIE